ncbi:NHLP-related RiPP peptide [Stenotrophomonas maltophilia]|uniref:NHLP-related RiPP peptide n=1 Tax=Stenotrophomonas riyadhensis TaxID=2859893 RepID=A0ABT2XMZ8_9GAMM|nr:NHLP-related RiPP peptide [Stenotrophomonas sp. CFS3442]MBH1618527.1 NHLP-related RiPP peptide [Stenotrophomonas maltophilia]MCV0324911.1 NHLP-related RiPP peptide [Stenotrophomonas sp. CFS3442]HEL4246270.1 NHLP-related RiPP peptide [Stenotrophomonas maltophilia]
MTHDLTPAPANAARSLDPLHSNDTAHASKTPLTAAQAALVLSLLQSNDEFRSAFASSPSLALRNLGVAPNADGSMCAPVQALASKDAFAAVAKALEQHLQSHGAFVLPHLFQADSIRDQVRLCEISRAA